jgi:4'-phosphopantetheinyl transferase
MTVWSEVDAESVFTAGAIEVAAARLDARPVTVRALSAWLCDAEQRRAARFRFDRDRRRFIVARARLRQLLAARLGVWPEAVEFAYGKNGKPGLAQRYADSGWRFNVAHCDDVAVYAFSREGDVGIDIEAIRAIGEADAIAARFFSRREYAAYAALAPRDRPVGFLECWTRKEAIVKALGEGLSMPLNEFDVSRAPGWSLHSFSPLPGFIAALACHHG